MKKNKASRNGHVAKSDDQNGFDEAEFIRTFSLFKQHSNTDIEIAMLNIRKCAKILKQYSADKFIVERTTVYYRMAFSSLDTMQMKNTSAANSESAEELAKSTKAFKKYSKKLRIISEDSDTPDHKYYYNSLMARYYYEFKQSPSEARPFFIKAYELRKDVSSFNAVRHGLNIISSLLDEDVRRDKDGALLIKKVCFIERKDEVWLWFDKVTELFQSLFDTERMNPLMIREHLSIFIANILLCTKTYDHISKHEIDVKKKIAFTAQGLKYAKLFRVAHKIWINKAYALSDYKIKAKDFVVDNEGIESYKNTAEACFDPKSFLGFAKGNVKYWASALRGSEMLDSLLSKEEIPSTQVEVIKLYEKIFTEHPAETEVRKSIAQLMLCERHRHLQALSPKPGLASTVYKVLLEKRDQIFFDFLVLRVLHMMFVDERKPSREGYLAYLLKNAGLIQYANIMTKVYFKSELVGNMLSEESSKKLARWAAHIQYFHIFFEALLFIMEAFRRRNTPYDEFIAFMMNDVPSALTERITEKIKSNFGYSGSIVSADDQVMSDALIYAASTACPLALMELSICMNEDSSEEANKFWLAHFALSIDKEYTPNIIPKRDILDRHNLLRFHVSLWLGATSITTSYADKDDHYSLCKALEVDFDLLTSTEKFNYYYFEASSQLNKIIPEEVDEVEIEAIKHGLSSNPFITGNGDNYLDIPNFKFYSDYVKAIYAIYLEKNYAIANDAFIAIYPDAEKIDEMLAYEIAERALFILVDVSLVNLQGQEKIDKMNENLRANKVHLWFDRQSHCIEELLKSHRSNSKYAAADHIALTYGQLIRYVCFLVEDKLTQANHSEVRENTMVAQLLLTCIRSLKILAEEHCVIFTGEVDCGDMKCLKNNGQIDIRQLASLGHLQENINLLNEFLQIRFYEVNQIAHPENYHFSSDDNKQSTEKAHKKKKKKGRRSKTAKPTRNEAQDSTSDHDDVQPPEVISDGDDGGEWQEIPSKRGAQVQKATTTSRKSRNRRRNRRRRHNLEALVTEDQVLPKKIVPEQSKGNASVRFFRPRSHSCSSLDGDRRLYPYITAQEPRLGMIEDMSLLNPSVHKSVITRASNTTIST